METVLRILVVVLVLALLALTAQASVPTARVRYIGTTGEGEGNYLNIPPDTEGGRLGQLWYWPRYWQLGYGVPWDYPLDTIIRIRNDGPSVVWVRVDAIECVPWERLWFDRSEFVIAPGRTVDVTAWYLLSSDGFETPIEQIVMSVGCSARIRAMAVGKW